MQKEKMAREDIEERERIDNLINEAYDDIKH